MAQLEESLGASLSETPERCSYESLTSIVNAAVGPCVRADPDSGGVSGDCCEALRDLASTSSSDSANCLCYPDVYRGLQDHLESGAGDPARGSLSDVFDLEAITGGCNREFDLGLATLEYNSRACGFAPRPEGELEERPTGERPTAERPTAQAEAEAKAQAEAEAEAMLAEAEARLAEAEAEAQAQAVAEAEAERPTGERPTAERSDDDSDDDGDGGMENLMRQLDASGPEMTA